jgi:hypothetical protein
VIFDAVPGGTDSTIRIARSFDEMLDAALTVSRGATCRRHVNTDPGVPCRQGVKIQSPLTRLNRSSGEQARDVSETTRTRSFGHSLNH